MVAHSVVGVRAHCAQAVFIGLLPGFLRQSGFGSWGDLGVDLR